MPSGELSFNISAMDGTAKVFDRLKTDVVALRGTVGGLGPGVLGAGNAVKLLSHQTQNLGFQINDLAQGLATGASPFRLIIQQGSQIAQVFAPGVGVPAALKATGAALTGFLLNPINLAVLGFAAAGEAASLLFANISTGSRAAAQQLELIESLTADIKVAFADAGKAAEDFGTRTLTGLRLDAERQLRESRAIFESTAADLAGVLSSGLAGLSDDLAATAFAADFGIYVDAVKGFIDEARAGKPDILGFRMELENLAVAQGADSAMRELGETLLEQVDASIDAAEGYLKAEANLAVLTGTATKAQKAFLGLADVLGLPELNQMRGPATLRHGTERLSAERRPGAGGGDDRDKVQDVIDGLRFEQDQLDRTAREQFIYNEAKRAGVTVGTDAAKGIVFEAGKLFDLRKELDENIAAMDALRDTAKDVLGGFIDDVREGKTVTDALSGSIDRLSARLLDSLLDKAIAGLFGAAGTTGSFLTQVGAAFGGARAGGGPVSAGRAYLVGERGPEIFMPGASGAISAGGGGVQIIDQRGAGAPDIETRPSPDGKGMLQAIIRETVNGPDVSRDLMTTFGLVPRTRRR